MGLREVGPGLLLGQAGVEQERKKGREGRENWAGLEEESQREIKFVVFLYKHTHHLTFFISNNFKIRVLQTLPSLKRISSSRFGKIREHLREFCDKLIFSFSSSFMLIKLMQVIN